MALATLFDVENRLGRTLAEDEPVLVATLLGDAEGLLISRKPDLRTAASGDLELRARAVAVEAAAVVRVLRNPGGYRSEQTGPFSYTIDTRAAAGFLTILDEEWRQLGVSGAFTIDPTPEMPTTVPFSVYDNLFGWQ
jgi:hypothetical protein